METSRGWGELFFFFPRLVQGRKRSKMSLTVINSTSSSRSWRLQRLPSLAVEFWGSVTQSFLHITLLLYTWYPPLLACSRSMINWSCIEFFNYLPCHWDPDRLNRYPIEHFPISRALKLTGGLILCYSKMSIDGFRGSKTAKCSAGCLHSDHARE